jgi:hypothetical protein
MESGTQTVQSAEDVIGETRGEVIYIIVYSVVIPTFCSHPELVLWSLKSQTLPFPDMTILVSFLGIRNPMESMLGLVVRMLVERGSEGPPIDPRLTRSQDRNASTGDTKNQGASRTKKMHKKESASKRSHRESALFWSRSASMINW